MWRKKLRRFFDGAHYVAHNATFDMGFLNSEYRRLGRPPVAPDLVIDTLALARRRHPMGPNSLDALCRRYGIDNSHRSKHGALLDAELLTDVYIEMLGGRQAALGLSASTTVEVERSSDDEIVVIGDRPTPPSAEGQCGGHSRACSSDRAYRNGCLVAQIRMTSRTPGLG